MSTITPSRPRVRVFRVGPEYALLVVLCQNVLVGPMMGDDGVDDVCDDVLMSWTLLLLLANTAPNSP